MTYLLEFSSECLHFHPWEVDTDLQRCVLGTRAYLRSLAGGGGFQGGTLLRDFEFTKPEAPSPPPAVTSVSG
jgi:hypothetical protein